MDWQLPSKATELILNAREMRDYLQGSYQLSALARRAPAVKYDHTASSGSLCPLSCQRSCQQY